MRVQTPPTLDPALLRLIAEHLQPGEAEGTASATAVTRSATPNIFLKAEAQAPTHAERRAVVAAIVEAHYGEGPWPPLIEGIIDGIAETAQGFGETLTLTWEIFSSEEKRQELMDMGQQLLDMGQELMALSPEERTEVLKEAGETVLEALFGSYEEFKENPSYFIGKLVGETLVGGVVGKLAKTIKGLEAVRKIVEKFQLRKKSPDLNPSDGPKAPSDGPKAPTADAPPKTKTPTTEQPEAPKDRPETAAKDRPESTEDRPETAAKDRPESTEDRTREGKDGPKKTKDGEGRDGPRTRDRDRSEGSDGPRPRRDRTPDERSRTEPETGDTRGSRDRPLRPNEPAPKIREPSLRRPALRGDPGETWAPSGRNTIHTSRDLTFKTNPETGEIARHPRTGEPIRARETRVYRHRALLDLNGNGPEATDTWVVVEFEIDIDWEDINQGGFRDGKLEALSKRRKQAQIDAVQERKAQILDDIDRNGFNLPDVSQWRTLQLGGGGNPTLAVDTPEGKRVYLELKANGELERFEGPSPRKKLGPTSSSDGTDGYGRNTELNAYRRARREHLAERGRISSNPRTKSNGTKAANTEAGDIWSGQGLDFHSNLPQRVQNIVKQLDNPETSGEVIELLRAKVDNYPMNTPRRRRAQKQLATFQNFEALKTKYGNFEVFFTRRGVPDFKRFVPSWAPKIQVAPSSPTMSPAGLRAKAAATADPKAAYQLRRQAARQEKRAELEAAIAQDASPDTVNRLKASLRAIDAREARRQFKEHSGLSWTGGTIQKQFDAADPATQAKIRAFMTKGKLDWDTKLSSEFRLHHGVNPGDVQIVPADLHDFIKHIGGSAYW